MIDRLAGVLVVGVGVAIELGAVLGWAGEVVPGSGVVNELGTTEGPGSGVK